MSHSQDSDDVECGIETIEGQISGRSPRDDEFANVIVYSSSDERMCFENVDCAADALKRLRWPAVDGDGEVEIEIRRVFEAEDFGPEFTPELREAEERMRAQAAKKR